MKTTFRTLTAVIFSGVCAAALAQTPGMGETRPLPDDRKAPAGAGTPKPRAEPGRELKRCEEFSATLREDCLREQRAADGAAAAGASRRPEPPTAPPPTNPLGR
jgi:hypothetical protein